MWLRNKIISNFVYDLLVLLFCQLIFVVPAGHGQDGLRLTMDLAQYQDSDRRPYLEIYYSFPEASVKYMANSDGSFSSRIVMAMQIYKENSLWASDLWKAEKTIEDTSKIKENSQMVDMVRYFLDEPAQYRIVIHARDMNQEGTMDSIATHIKTKKYSPNNLELSDVQLASHIRKPSNQSSKFVKNHYEVIPNPTLVFGEGTPILYYCFEAYNLLNNVPGTKYKCLAFLKDSNGSVVAGLGKPAHTKKKKYDFSVEIGMINISKLPTGQYFFVYGISDSTGAQLVAKEKKFYIYNSSVPFKPLAQAGAGMRDHTGTLGELESLTNEQLDHEYESMKYLTTKQNREFYQNLTNPEAKRQFIYSIWQSKTNDEGLTSMNYRLLYLSRVKVANERFKATGKQGWKTDQGRVFILYGPPTNIERFPSSPSNKPYQIWTYDNLQGQGGVIFVFVDRFGFNRYELLHSTLRGELQDPFWPRYLVIGPQQTIRN